MSPVTLCFSSDPVSPWCRIMACSPRSPTKWEKTSLPAMHWRYVTACVHPSHFELGFAPTFFLHIAKMSSVVYPGWWFLNRLVLWCDLVFLSSSQGSVAIAGAVVRWLKDNMGIVQSSSEIGTYTVESVLIGIMQSLSWSGILTVFWLYSERK